MWPYCCSFLAGNFKKGYREPSVHSSWNQPGFGHPIPLVLLPFRKPSQNFFSHFSRHTLSPEGLQTRLLAGCFAIDCPSNSLILFFFLFLVGAVRRKVAATEMRLRLTPWSLTGRKQILIFPQKQCQIVVCALRWLRVFLDGYLSVSASWACLCFVIL